MRFVNLKKNFVDVFWLNFFFFNVETLSSAVIKLYLSENYLSVKLKRVRND